MTEMPTADPIETARHAYAEELRFRARVKSATVVKAFATVQAKVRKLGQTTPTATTIANRRFAIPPAC